MANVQGARFDELINHLQSVIEQISGPSILFIVVELVSYVIKSNRSSGHDGQALEIYTHIRN